MTKHSEQIWHAEVVGSGSFPMDMLRYDRCLPATEVDSNTILRSALESMIVSDNDSYKVEVYGYGIKGPTVGRWESFGWRVATNDALLGG
jgi:hypothetical protein